MKLQPPSTPLPACVFEHPSGYEARVSVGSGATRLKAYRFFSRGTDYAVMTTWIAQARERLRAQRAAHPRPARDTLTRLVEEFFSLLTADDCTEENRDRLRQRLQWFLTQPAAKDAPVFPAPGGATTPVADVPIGRRLGDLPVVRVKLGLGTMRGVDTATIQRMRQILSVAFAPTNPRRDPTEFARTSNLYRAAWARVFTIINRDVWGAVNPMDTLETRPEPAAANEGVDLRIIRDVLKHTPGHWGNPGDGRSMARLAVLAWVPIEPEQLMKFNPATDFHDVPDATDEELRAGVVTVTIQPRRKGRSRIVPQPERHPLTPIGVAAMRQFAATPSAVGPFVVSSLNRMLQRGVARYLDALAAEGIEFQFTGLTLKLLRHSYASALTLASNGLVDRHGQTRVDEGVSKALGHRQRATTRIYTTRTVDPTLAKATAMLSTYLDALFATPLFPKPLTLVHQASTD